MQTLVIVLQVISVLASLASIALSIMNQLGHKTLAAGSGVGASLAVIFGSNPTLSTLSAFVGLSNEVLGSQLLNTSLIGTLFDLTLIGLGFWVLTGHSVGGTVVSRSWGVVFLLTGLFFIGNKHKSQRLAAAAQVKLISNQQQKG